MDFSNDITMSYVSHRKAANKVGRDVIKYYEDENPQTEKGASNTIEKETAAADKMIKKHTRVGCRWAKRGDGEMVRTGLR